MRVIAFVFLAVTAVPSVASAQWPLLETRQQQRDRQRYESAAARQQQCVEFHGDRARRNVSRGIYPGDVQAAVHECMVVAGLGEFSSPVWGGPMILPVPAWGNPDVILDARGIPVGPREGSQTWGIIGAGTGAGIALLSGGDLKKVAGAGLTGYAAGRAAGLLAKGLRPRTAAESAPEPEELIIENGRDRPATILDGTTVTTVVPARDRVEVGSPTHGFRAVIEEPIDGGLTERVEYSLKKTKKGWKVDKRVN